MDQELMVGSVRVVNGNDFTIKDMFDGVPFTFDPGKAVTIPTDAANHIFGWRSLMEGESPANLTDEMLVYCQKRHGWNTPEVVRSGNHQKWFGKLEFKPVRFRLVEVNDDEEESLPNMLAPPEGKQKAK